MHAARSNVQACRLAWSLAIATDLKSLEHRLHFGTTRCGDFDNDRLSRKRDEGRFRDVPLTPPESNDTAKAEHRPGVGSGALLA